MKVRTGSVYTFKPNAWDILDPKTNLNGGEKVRVCKLPGCPPPNTMGCCHVEDMKGKFLGLVSTGSLRNDI